LGGRKGIRPVKKLEWLGAGVVVCLDRGADLHMAQLMPLPLTVSCFCKIQTGFFSFLVPAHRYWVVPDKGPLNGCVSLSYEIKGLKHEVSTLPFSVSTEILYASSLWALLQDNVCALQQTVLHMPANARLLFVKKYFTVLSVYKSYSKEHRQSMLFIKEASLVKFYATVSSPVF